LGILEAGDLVKLRYDAEVHVLSIVLSDSPVEESDETSLGSCSMLAWSRYRPNHR
jgi:hypothetical protein